MTAEEAARVKWACAWVRVTAGLLPYLRTFLVARLARRHAGLAGKIAGLNTRQLFDLWEHLKDEQSSSADFLGRPGERALEEAWE
jgi:hypothetical protein